VADGRVPATARRREQVADDDHARRGEPAGGRRERQRLLVSHHTLDGSSSTIPAIHDDIICAGAAAYAALDWTSYATNRINTGGDDVHERYSRFAHERLRYFEAELRRIGIRNSVRQRRMYTTDAPSIFEQSRVKY
jgi:hypothetical protein